MLVYETLRNNLLVDDLLDGQPEFARQHLRQVIVWVGKHQLYNWP